MDEHLPAPTSDILIFQTEDGRTKIDVRLSGNTVWLSQKMMAELFQTTVANINQHLKNIFEDGELNPDAVIKEFLITASDGKNYKTMCYNLDSILAVGYRVKSHVGIHFRRWATERLKEYLVKGFTMDDERLKAVATPFGADYFDELLERIRDIRASEKRFYQKIKDIYATSVDYDARAEVSQEFFAMVQNKLHWAIHGHTAAELMIARADASKPNMGLMTWKGAKPRRADVTVAKNYLTEDELKSLNRIVTMYLDYAIDQAERHIPMHMQDWVEKLNAFLEFNGREVLDNPGRVSKAVADTLALGEYAKYSKQQIGHDSKNAEDTFEVEIKSIKFVK